MKQGNTQRSAALMNIVADHKWLVSGTPVNTSWMDLRNPLRFLGIEDVDRMMEAFKFSAFAHTSDTSAGRFRTEWPAFGNLLFFLRNIMIRHTQKQKYRGTNTTLMSLPEKVNSFSDLWLLVLSSFNSN